MLSPAQIAAKKHRRELRRKKLRAQHQREERLMVMGGKGSMEVAKGVRNRKLKNRRNHHRRKDYLLQEEVS